MKKLALIITGILVSAFAYADVQSSSFKGSPSLNQLGGAFKIKPSVEPKLNSSDILMGYAGQDISRKPTLAGRTTII